MCNANKGTQKLDDPDPYRIKNNQSKPWDFMDLQHKSWIMFVNAEGTGMRCLVDAQVFENVIQGLENNHPVRLTSAEKIADWRPNSHLLVMQESADHLSLKPIVIPAILTTECHPILNHQIEMQKQFQLDAIARMQECLDCLDMTALTHQLFTLQKQKITEIQQPTSNFSEIINKPPNSNNVDDSESKVVSAISSKFDQKKVESRDITNKEFLSLNEIPESKIEDFINRYESLKNHTPISKYFRNLIQNLESRANFKFKSDKIELNEFAADQLKTILSTSTWMLDEAREEEDNQFQSSYIPLTLENADKLIIFGEKNDPNSLDDYRFVFQKNDVLNSSQQAMIEASIFTQFVVNYGVALTDLTYIDQGTFPLQIINGHFTFCFNKMTTSISSIDDPDKIYYPIRWDIVFDSNLYEKGEPKFDEILFNPPEFVRQKYKEILFPFYSLNRKHRDRSIVTILKSYRQFRFFIEYFGSSFISIRKYLSDPNFHYFNDREEYEKFSQDIKEFEMYLVQDYNIFKDLLSNYCAFYGNHNGRVNKSVVKWSSRLHIQGKNIQNYNPDRDFSLAPEYVINQHIMNNYHLKIVNPVVDQNLFFNFNDVLMMRKNSPTALIIIMRDILQEFLRTDINQESFIDFDQFMKCAYCASKVRMGWHQTWILFLSLKINSTTPPIIEFKGEKFRIGTYNLNFINLPWDCNQGKIALPITLNPDGPKIKILYKYDWERNNLLFDYSQNTIHYLTKYTLNEEGPKSEIPSIFYSTRIKKCIDNADIFRLFKEIIEDLKDDLTKSKKFNKSPFYSNNPKDRARLIKIIERIQQSFIDDTKLWEEIRDMPLGMEIDFAYQYKGDILIIIELNSEKLECDSPDKSDFKEVNPRYFWPKVALAWVLYSKKAPLVIVAKDLAAKKQYQNYLPKGYPVIISTEFFELKRRINNSCLGKPDYVIKDMIKTVFYDFFLDRNYGEDQPLKLWLDQILFRKNSFGELNWFELVKTNSPKVQFEIK